MYPQVKTRVTQKTINVETPIKYIVVEDDLYWYLIREDVATEHSISHEVSIEWTFKLEYIADVVIKKDRKYQYVQKFLTT